MGRGLFAALMLLATIGAATTAGQEPTGRTGMMYGPGHAYTVTAPEGWVLDNQVGRAMGLHAIFYPEGETWRSAEAFMYVNTAGPDSGETASAEAVARRDSLEFVSHNPDIVIRIADPIQLKNGSLAIVRHFSGDVHGNFEATAYLPEKTVTPIFVLSARSEEAFKRALPVFVELVKSYHFVGTEPPIPPPPYRLPVPRRTTLRHPLWFDHGE